MDAGGEALLSQRSDHPRRQQEGSPPGRTDKTRADEDETGTGSAR